MGVGVHVDRRATVDELLKKEKKSKLYSFKDFSTISTISLKL